MRYERQARRWTLDRLAAASEVSRRLIVTLEQGRANPGIGILLRLSDALGVGPSALVEQPRGAALAVHRSGTGPVLWSSGVGGRAVLVANTVEFRFNV